MRTMQLLPVVLFVVSLPCLADDKRATVSVEKSTSVNAFRNLLGDNGGKLGVISACVWAFGVAAAPHASCRAATVKWDDGLTIDGWFCDGMALMSTPNMAMARYDSGKLTVTDGKTGQRPAMLSLDDAGSTSAATVFKNIYAQKLQFKMLVWPLNCIETSGEPFERDKR